MCDAEGLTKSTDNEERPVCLVLFHIHHNEVFYRNHGTTKPTSITGTETSTINYTYNPKKSWDRKAELSASE